MDKLVCPCPTTCVERRVMATIKIKQHYCKGCMLCIPLCPTKALVVSKMLNNYGIHPVVFKENGKCNGCKACALICPDVAIEILK